jgi:hypothetical protein
LAVIFGDGILQVVRVMVPYTRNNVSTPMFRDVIAAQQAIIGEAGKGKIAGSVVTERPLLAQSGHSAGSARRRRANTGHAAPHRRPCRAEDLIPLRSAGRRSPCMRHHPIAVIDTGSRFWFSPHSVG